MLSLRIHQTSALKTTQDVEISVLINSIFFFLSYVFIMRIDGQYRLLVLLNNKLLYQGVYNTGKGAKIAFSRLYQDKAWKKVKAQWTHFYPPEGSWLDEKLQIVEPTKG
jgi:hypothetical protein